jgi:hypothetical protein
MVEKMNQDEDEKSVLQNKLDDMTKLITRAGMLAGSHMQFYGSLCQDIMCMHPCTGTRTRISSVDAYFFTRVTHACTRIDLAQGAERWLLQNALYLCM